MWQVICFTQEDWFQLAKKFKKSSSKAEKQLYKTLTENFLPELPRLFQEKEKLARKKLLEKPRKSSRLQKLVRRFLQLKHHLYKLNYFLCKNFNDDTYSFMKGTILLKRKNILCILKKEIKYHMDITLSIVLF